VLYKDCELFESDDFSDESDVISQGFSYGRRWQQMDVQTWSILRPCFLCKLMSASCFYFHNPCATVNSVLRTEVSLCCGLCAKLAFATTGTHAMMAVIVEMFR
jgi:hypothetical protein